MLILFTEVEGEGPDLPDLNIADSSTSLDVPVAGIEGWDNDFIQVLKQSYAPMSMVSAGGLAVDAQTILFWTKRLSQVTIRVEFTDSGASCTLYPVYFDANDVIVLGESITLTATAYQVSGRYLAPVGVVETYGARKIAFFTTAISAGSAYLQAAGV